MFSARLTPFLAQPFIRPLPLVCTLLSCTALSACDSSVGVEASSSPTHRRESDEVEALEIYALEGQAPAVRFSALGREFSLALEENHSTIAAGATVRRNGREIPLDELDLEPVYRGTVAGEKDSWVRLSLRDSQLDGLMFVEGELYELRHSLGSSATRIAPYGAEYREFLRSHGNKHECGLDGELLGQGPTGIGHFRAAAAAPCQILRIRFVADHTFYDSHPGVNEVENTINSRMNEIDGIYRNDLSFGFTIAGIEVFETAGSPSFNAASNLPIDYVLTELRRYRGDNNHAQDSGLTHLVTSRYRDGAVGLAGIGVTCDAIPQSGGWVWHAEAEGAGAGVSSEVGGRGSTIVLAHELGHNFGAPHDAQGGSPCASTQMGWIMQPSVDGDATSFSACSQDEVAAHTGAVGGSEYSCYQACDGGECGNGIVEGTEECDDGNTVNDDDCANDCTDVAVGDDDDDGTGTAGTDSVGDSGVVDSDGATTDVMTGADDDVGDEGCACSARPSEGDGTPLWTLLGLFGVGQWRRSRRT